MQGGPQKPVTMLIFRGVTRVFFCREVIFPSCQEHQLNSIDLQVTLMDSKQVGLWFVWNGVGACDSVGIWLSQWPTGPNLVGKIINWVVVSIFVIFNPIFGEMIQLWLWLIFLKWAETTNEVMIRYVFGVVLEVGRKSCQNYRPTSFENHVNDDVCWSNSKLKIESWIISNSTGNSRDDIQEKHIP